MSNSIIVRKGHVFTVKLQAASATRYSWVLCTKPDEAGLVDVSLKAQSAHCGGPVEKTFWLVALKMPEGGSFDLVFQLLPLCPLEAPAEIVIITVKVQEDGAKNAIDSSAFVQVTGNTATYASDACMPHPELLSKYAMPPAFDACPDSSNVHNKYGISPCVLKYGFYCDTADSAK